MTAAADDAKGEKRLEQMLRNPCGDWRIDDVRVVCRSCGVDCRKPSEGSHYVVSHPTRATRAEMLTIPFNGPIKAVYIKLLVGFIQSVEDAIDGRP
jgi:hypothetical protein